MTQQYETKDRRSNQVAADCDWPGVVVELSPAPDPVDAFLRLSQLPNCIFFDSARRDPNLGRYSFIAVDPFQLISGSPSDATIWMKIERAIAEFAAPTLPGVPPFQGGLAGIFSYDLSRTLERLPKPRFDEFQLPGAVLGLYDVVVAFDHQTAEAWIVSQGFPEQDCGKRHRRAKQRAADFAAILSSAHHDHRPTRAGRSPIDLQAPRFAVGNLEGLTSNFTREQYLSMIRRGIECIFAGDVFQVNLAQRLLYPASDESVSLYLRLRERNPAPFAAYFDLGDLQIVSASPERFLQVSDRQVEARPIKGTRARNHDSQANRSASDELLASEKDRAENIMIVDLLRNDLSRVCTPESVTVAELCRLEQYQFVQHLVSVVQGELRTECGALDLLKAAFPGGSVTGAPKIRAMEIIAELESTARGAYCGSLGYIGFDGAMDSSILIRSITTSGGWWQFSVGGGIVAQSDPEREYQETWEKAEGLLRALN